MYEVGMYVIDGYGEICKILEKYGNVYHIEIIVPGEITEEYRTHWTLPISKYGYKPIPGYGTPLWKVLNE
jgi:hypothetical protein